ncbi:MAG: pilus assembly protein N-terminal domain-containing protein [Myxococcales bacterium]|nr:pilus assembly protein N-terminal domain-containing protein [Myxococcales bacterium]
MRLLHRVFLVTSLAACAGGAFVARERSALAQKKETHDEIGLAVGETKTLSAAGVKEYSEGVKGVVDVVTTPDGTRFILTGRKPGTTTLLLIKNDGSQAVYDITVATRSPQVVEREVQQLLEGVVGVRVRRIGGRIFIEGGVSTENDQKRVQQIASLYPGQVESLVIIGSAAERKLLVRLDFFFVQYEKTSSYAVGLGWPDAIGGTANQAQVFQNAYTYDFVARTTTSAQASIVNQPLPRLDIASRHGWAKIAKQSSVITANGNEATFQSGGEQNFLQAVNLTTTLVSVKFGTNVTVLPRYDSNSKDLEIKVVADVADLTPPASGTVPGRTTTKLETQVTLRLGQALVLSGIKTATQRRDVQGLPGLSEIPVLGLLFGSHRQEKAEVEGAVFIVPSVVDTVPKSALELINNAMSTYKEYSGEIEYVDAYPKAPPSAK